jgi:TRAP-type C4-dicarboxylate transport system substrate-binding protein
MPGLFTSWTQLDRARDALKSSLEKGAMDAGFHIAGWYDVGLIRMLSTGFAIKVPDDLKGKKAWSDRDDVIWPAVYQAIGGVNGVSRLRPQVLNDLDAGTIAVIPAPCLVAEGLRWSGEMNNLNDAVIGTEIGAIVISPRRLEALPQDLKTILKDTAYVAADALKTKIRLEDERSFKRLKRQMTVTKPSAANQTKWEAIFKTARERLAQGTFSPDLVTELEAYAEQ